MRTSDTLAGPSVADSRPLAVCDGGRPSGEGRMASPEFDHVPISPDQIVDMDIGELWPAPENDQLYRPVDAADPEFGRLVESIGRDGVREPLVVTLDRYIISGHRRHAAAEEAGLAEVPCRFADYRRSDDPDRFVRDLREYNRQRIKTAGERLREEVLDVDPDDAYRVLQEHRQRKSAISVEAIRLHGETRRAKISKAKRPFRQAIEVACHGFRNFWPVSDRQIHYALLNNPPLKHASKPDSRYRNDLDSYKALVDMLTRMRLCGMIPFAAIADVTRPVTIWEVHAEPGGYFREELDGFLKGYARDLMQSQPNHVEIVGEKNTIGGIIHPVAAEFCIPYTLGRGYSSLPPRYEMVERFRKSGKERLVLLFLSDCDPEGDDIPHSFARSLRDDFGVAEEKLHPVRVALTVAQAGEHRLPPIMQAKKGSSRYAKFVAEHGQTVHELESLAPAALQKILRATITNVIDVEAFNREVEAEKKDWASLTAARKTACDTLKDMNFDDEAKEGRRNEPV